MKNIHLYIYLLGTLFIALSFSACKSTIPDVEGRGTLSVSTQTIVLENDGGTRTIEVNASDGDWQLVPNIPTWIKSTITESLISLEIEPNKESQERDAELTIYAPKSKLTKKVLVKQFGINPALHVDQERVVFDRNGGRQTVSLVVNGSDWTVSQPTPAEWLQVDRDVATNTLILTANEVDKEAEGSGESRSTLLILSYGTSHHILQVRQDGWQYFPFPLLTRNPTRDEILQHAQAEEWTRDVEYERQWREFYGDDQQRVMAFRTTALEGQVVAYYFNKDDTNILEHAYVRAEKGAIFTEERLKEWLDANGFHYSMKKENGTRGGEDIYYFAPTEEHSTYLTINNSETYYILNPDGQHRGAMMEFARFSNDAELNNRKDAWLNLPLRNTIWIDDPKYGLDDVIEYEKKRGMIPAYNDEETILNDISGYEHIKYKQLAFLPENVSSVGKGELRKVVYLFNVPGWIDEDLNKPKEFISNNPALAGSIAQRYDLYEGDDRGPFMINLWSGMYFLSTTFIDKAEAAGFGLKDQLQEQGWFYFASTWKKMVLMVRPIGDRTMVSFGTDEKVYKNLTEREQ